MLLLLKKWYSKNDIHIIVWTCFITYEVFITKLLYGGDRTLTQYANFAIHYALNIALFYFHANGIIKILQQKSGNRIWMITVFIIIELGLYFAFGYLLEYLSSITYNTELKKILIFDKHYVFRSLYRCIYFLGFSTGYIFLLNSLRERKRVEALERQNLVTQIEKQALENDLVQSQNNFLRSQINPHFLFNTLNFIYNDARKKAPMAADAIMNLAEMMRYALKRPEASELVPLSEEIEQIEHLINLHQLRTANKVNLELQINGDLFGLRFPPLILLTLVENIFKHGNIAHSTQPALIKIDYENQQLKISTINMINEVAKRKVESHHVGLENIGKRLQNFYGDRYVFKYEKDALNRYITEIRIDVVNPMAGLNG